MAKKNYFHHKAIKFNADKEDNSEEINKLQFAIESLHSAGQPVPQSIIEELAKLKRENSGGNKVNATKIIYSGTEYDSRREANLAKTLTENKIPFDHQVQVELIPSFEVGGEKIRPLTIIVDFLIAGEWFVDVKGIEMEVFKLKWKLLKNMLRDTKKYHLIHKDSEIQTFVALVKREQWQSNDL